MIRVLRSTLVVAIASASTYLTGQITRTETVKVGTINRFYPGTSYLELTAHKEVTANKRQNAKYLSVHVVNDFEGKIGLTDIPLTDISIILKNLEQMVEESSKSSDDLSYNRPQNKFLASIRGSPEPSVSFFVGGVLVATDGRSESENRKTLQDFIGLLTKGKAILESQAK